MNTKILNILMSSVMALNIMAGLFGLPAIICLPVFVTLLGVARWQFLKAESASAQGNSPPAAIRIVAVAVTALIMANALYWLGFLGHWLLEKML